MRMITLEKVSPNTAVQTQQPDDTHCFNWQKASFLQEVIDSLQDGILILSETGEIIHSNKSASRMISQLNQDSSNAKSVPPDIWRLCESLQSSRNLSPDNCIILSHEIALDKSTIFRLRVRWIDLDYFENSCLFVTIENIYESLTNLALAEVQKFGLTPREAEVWLLYRAKFSYKEIAAQLYITVNTVKKHMKNIHAKRQEFLDGEA